MQDKRKRFRSKTREDNSYINKQQKRKARKSRQHTKQRTAVGCNLLGCKHYHKQIHKNIKNVYFYSYVYIYTYIYFIYVYVLHICISICMYMYMYILHYIEHATLMCAAHIVHMGQLTQRKSEENSFKS